MSIRNLIALSAVLSLVALAGCERSTEEGQTPTAAKPAAAKTAAKTAVKPAKAEAPAHEGASCGAHKGKPGHDCEHKMGESCGGMDCSGGCDKWGEAAAEVAKRDVPETAVWETLEVGGMTCASCEERVVAGVGAVEGIVAVEANHELGQVRVALASKDNQLKTKAIEAISSLGYTVQ